MRRRCHVTIHGRVQEVGLRSAVRHQARVEGCSGWVKNAADGGVELEVEGQAATVALFLAWLKQDPGYAHPTELVVSDIAPQGEAAFAVLS